MIHPDDRLDRFAVIRRRYARGYWVAMIFWPGGKPQLIAGTQIRTPHDDLSKGYLNSVYLLDTCYQFSLGAINQACITWMKSR